MLNLKELNKIKAIISSYREAELLVVTKNRSSEEIKAVLKAGIKKIGENRLQEAEQKFSFLKKFSFQKHLIGHLQKNKVKKAVILFDVIESIDSFSLAFKLNQECEKINKIMPIFLQVNISNDTNKYGFLEKDFISVCKKIVQLKNLKVQGLMTIPKMENKIEKTKKYFKSMKNLYKKVVQSKIFDADFKYLSMGMSSDFELALKEGSSLVRIGRKIFN